MADIRVACWNLQNLFDTTASNIAADLEFTPEQGWTAEALDKKLTNLATVIKAMHGGQGPDLLGIVEVETKELLEQLILRTGLPNLTVAARRQPRPARHRHLAGLRELAVRARRRSRSTT